MKTDTHFWDQRRNTITSSKGGWKVGEAVYNHRYSMMDDLVGQKSYMQVMILNATGRLPERRLADWFEARQICMSWPDSRIWCNQIGALAGSMRTSVVAATVAGVLGADSRAYGGSKTVIAGLEFIQHAYALLTQGWTVEAIVDDECAKHGGKPHIMGYARPIAKGDERIPAMQKVSAQLGFEVGPHLQLAYQIEQVLIERYDERMNINGYVSAFLSDQGLTPEEVYRISATLVASGVTACYVDAVEKQPESFLPLRCDDVQYQGKAPRPLPKAKNEERPFRVVAYTGR